MTKQISYDPECWCEDASSKNECAECGVKKVNNKWQFIPGHSYYYKCRHLNFPVEFNNNVTVYASSHKDREDQDELPDWGLYLDTIWKPNSMCGYIEWPDFDIPRDWKVAAKMIVDTYRKACAGYWVEVSCIGGHGRTGTVLACMAVLSGLEPDEAIEFVRTNYCSKAIETNEQKWWVHWFKAYVFGGSSPKSPVKNDQGAMSNTIYAFAEGIEWESANLLGWRGRKPKDTSLQTVHYRYVKKPDSAKEDDTKNNTEEEVEAFEYVEGLLGELRAELDYAKKVNDEKVIYQITDWLKDCLSETV